MPRIISEALARKRIDEAHGGSIAMVGPYSLFASPAEFRCKRGHQFVAHPREVARGKGCRKCADMVRRDRYLRDVQGVHAEIKAAHDDAVRMAGDYRGGWKNVGFVCSSGHKWQAKPLNVTRQRSGCPFCAPSRGFDRSKAGTTYYLRIDRSGKSPLYKIGITNEASVMDRFRFSADKTVISVLREWNFTDGRDAWSLERSLIAAHKSDRYRGPLILRSGGNTELFVRDILQLDAS